MIDAAASGALPPVTSADEGKVLAVDGNGVWAAQNPKFVVTLTPTSLDYSGTMDKTVGEITEAYLSGKRIVFFISASGMNVEFPLVDVNKHDDYDYPSFDAVLWNVIDNVFMHVETACTDDADKDTYDVYTFPMTYNSASGVSF